MTEDFSPLWKQRIRPYAFISTLIIFFILMILDGNIGEFHVRDIYLKILEAILTTMIIFYFTSRGVEKTVGLYTQGKIKQEEMKTKQNTESEDVPEMYKKFKKESE